MAAAGSAEPVRQRAAFDHGFGLRVHARRDAELINGEAGRGRDQRDTK